MQKIEFTCDPKCPLYQAGIENYCGIENNDVIRYFLVIFQHWVNDSGSGTTIMGASYQSTPPMGCQGAHNHKHHS